jgi:hypothetical protein
MTSFLLVAGSDEPHAGSMARPPRATAPFSRVLRGSASGWKFIALVLSQVPKRAAGPLCRFPSLTMRM